VSLLGLSCSDKKQEKITIDTPRELTVLDKVDQKVPTKTSATPLTQAVSSNYQYVKPEAWVDKEATPFRLLNFTFGTDGEAYLSESRGGVLPNVNRWLGQFGADPATSLDDLESFPVLSGKGYLVSAEGAFKGMRMPQAKPNYMLLGVLVEIDGQLITIKMTGPANEVKQQEQAVKSFCKSLKYTK